MYIYIYIYIYIYMYILNYIPGISLGYNIETMETCFRER